VVLLCRSTPLFVVAWLSNFAEAKSKALLICEPAPRATHHRLSQSYGKATMRVIFAAAFVALGQTATAHAGLRYYIDHDVLRKNEAPNLLHRAMRDIGRNPTGWSHRWCGRQMAMWVGEGPNLAREWAYYGKPTIPKPGTIGVMNGHVGVVKEVESHRVILVSGNHSGKSGNRKVGIGSYPMSRFIAFREP
jgi:hypothetical protein